MYVKNEASSARVTTSGALWLSTSTVTPTSVVAMRLLATSASFGRQADARSIQLVAAVAETGLAPWRSVWRHSSPAAETWASPAHPGHASGKRPVLLRTLSSATHVPRFCCAVGAGLAASLSARPSSRDPPSERRQTCSLACWGCSDHKSAQRQQLSSKERSRPSCWQGFPPQCDWMKLQTLPISKMMACPPIANLLPQP